MVCGMVNTKPLLNSLKLICMCNRQARKKGRGERLPEMGVEEGAFASGPVLRGDRAHYFFDIF